jgi:tRNA splicing endonuclease
MDIYQIIKSLARKRPVFHNEADLQHSLAWEIKETYPNCKIRLEKRVNDQRSQKIYLDILVDLDGRKIAIELKYKTRSYELLFEDEDYLLNNHGAQDTGRYDVLKDLQRLEYCVDSGFAHEGILVFLTNDASYFSDPGKERVTVDQDFRFHEGRRINGNLSWSNQTGPGTMKGREEPIFLKGNFVANWHPYSQLGDSSKGDFRYLSLHVLPTAREHRELFKEQVVSIPVVSVQKSSFPFWFNSFTAKGEVPISQFDLRDKLAQHLKQLGYRVDTGRHVGTAKIDIWAENSNDNESIAIEVRYKTASLQTMHQDKHVHLKNQGAQDVSRYDFLKDLEKVEHVVAGRPGMKGYALLITNDHLYWNSPKKQDSVDEDFLVYEERILNGILSWRENASKGTTSGREAPIRLNGSYRLNWQHYLNLGEGKNKVFQALVVEV